MIGAITGLGSAYSTYSPYKTAAVAAPDRTEQVQQAQNTQKSSGIWTGHKAAQPEVPVQPVRPVTPVSTQAAEPAGLGLPIREGVDPVEMSVRMRIQYVGDAAGAVSDGEAAPQGVEGVLKAAEEGKCETCEERKYQDGSDDMGVSYQTPTRIDPDLAASAVRGHEMEHVVREQAKAQREDRKVVSQSVTMHTDICPECGKVYVSGGTTRTVTAAQTDQQQQNAAQQGQQTRVPFFAVA